MHGWRLFRRASLRVQQPGRSLDREFVYSLLHATADVKTLGASRLPVPPDHPYADPHLRLTSIWDSPGLLVTAGDCHLRSLGFSNSPLALRHAGLRYCGHVMAHAYRSIDPSAV